MTMGFSENFQSAAATAPDKRRRNWSNAEKVAIVRKTYEPGGSVSVTARQHGIATSMLFRWRKMERNGELKDTTEIANLVPVTELLSAREQIAALQRALGAMTLEIQLCTLENQHLRKAMGVGSSKAWSTRPAEAAMDPAGALSHLWNPSQRSV